VTNLSIRVYGFILGLVTDLRENEKGQDLLEYAMLGGLIAAAIVAVLVLFTDAIETMITGIGNCIDFNSATSCDPGF
jgi:Flp pilus assembly pilin Flp